MAVIKAATLYNVVDGSSGLPKNPVITFTSAIEEVIDEEIPANKRAMANSKPAKRPARGVRVRDACWRLLTITPFLKNTETATIIMAELIAQPRSMAVLVSIFSNYVKVFFFSSVLPHFLLCITLECKNILCGITTAQSIPIAI